jgi:hypothetical protein
MSILARREDKHCGEFDGEHAPDHPVGDGGGGEPCVFRGGLSQAAAYNAKCIKSRATPSPTCTSQGGIR